MITEMQWVWNGWLTPLLLVPFIFAYPTGGPKRCERCGEDISGTDAFWDFRFTPYCDGCKSSLSDAETQRFLTRKMTYCGLLQSVLRMRRVGDPVPPDDVEQEATETFVQMALKGKLHSGEAT